MQTKAALIVDDQQEVRESLRKALEWRGWLVHEANSARDALRLWPLLSPKPEIMVADLRMESLNAGIVLANFLTAEHPALKVIIISGFLSGLENIPQHFTFLQKPFEMEVFCALVDRITAQPSPQ